MIAKIAYAECIRRFPSLPKADVKRNSFFFPDAINSRVLLLHSKSARGHATLLASELAKMIRRLTTGALIFCGDAQTPWRVQESDSPPAQVALGYLKANKVGKGFDGGLEVDPTELPKFIKHLFWLVRCHAALPVIHFMDLEQSFVGSVCQYGNVHISTITPAAELAMQAATPLSRFVESSVEKCHSTFTKTAKIAHRQTVV
jgi:hypothetical protein